MNRRLTRHHLVIWYFAGRVRINNHGHPLPTPASCARLARLLARDSYYTELTQAATIHHVRR